MAQQTDNSFIQDVWHHFNNNWNYTQEDFEQFVAKEVRARYLVKYLAFDGFRVTAPEFGTQDRVSKLHAEMKLLPPYSALLGEMTGQLGNWRPLQHYPLTADGKPDRRAMERRKASAMVVFPWARDWFYSDGNPKWSFIQRRLRVIETGYYAQ